MNDLPWNAVSPGLLLASAFGKVWLSWYEGSAIGAVSILPLGLPIQSLGGDEFVMRAWLVSLR